MRNRYRVPSHGDLEAELLTYGSLFYPSERKSERSRGHSKEGNKVKRTKCRSRDQRSQKIQPTKLVVVRHSETDKPILNGFGNKISCKNNYTILNTNSPAENSQFVTDSTPEKAEEFSWIFFDTPEEKGTGVGDILSVTTTTLADDVTEGLSQTRTVPGPINIASEMHGTPSGDIREALEEEIKRKYAEIDALMNQLNSKRSKKRQRFSRRTNVARHNSESGNASLPTQVIVHPIRRHKRLAQPIRNAVLIRSSMKKAWKGSLGSCCGMGCWATWNWVNMKGVMSDYE